MGPQVERIGTSVTNGCILYQDESKLVTLLDLPSSISYAQFAPEQQLFPKLRSCEPIEVPYATSEPKTARASQRVQSRSCFFTIAREHEQIIQTGLKSISEHCQRVWCLPRAIDLTSEHRKVHNRKRKVDNNWSSPQTHEPHLLAQSLSGVSSMTILQNSQHVTIPTASSFQNRCIINSQPTQLSLHISESDAIYLIPPKSSFVFTSLSPNSNSLLSIALLSIAPDASTSASPGEFDLILLDPPWSNRSARRAAPYAHASIGEDPFCGFAGILPQHLAKNGFVACWVTHAQATRTAVEQLFEQCDIDIVEEWTWAKVTRHGNPTVPLNSQWRRGWEVLIVGRRRSEDDLEVSAGIPQLVRRLIVAVPDLHSRKPCLKELFEQLLLKQKDGRVLEVFARHLVAGWCSIGDEVLRFNWSGHWESSTP